jgi:hypothetical protein
MSRCSSGFHPQVPVTMVALALTYCHQCMAWRRSLSIYTTGGDELLDVELAINLEYGPFDPLDTVVGEALAEFLAEMKVPGRPWDTWSDSAS